MAAIVWQIRNLGNGFQIMTLWGQMRSHSISQMTWSNNSVIITWKWRCKYILHWYHFHYTLWNYRMPPDLGRFNAETVWMKVPSQPLRWAHNRCPGTGDFTDAEISFWWNSRHCMNTKLPCWQLLLHPVTKISSIWRYFRFVVEMSQTIATSWNVCQHLLAATPLTSATCIYHIIDSDTDANMCTQLNIYATMLILKKGGHWHWFR